MARPRKPSDPHQWPVPCDRCDGHYQIVAAWPDGGVCGYCYQQAKRTRGTCACGHEGVLPGRIHGQPACRPCSGVRLNIDCKTCGAEDELYQLADAGHASSQRSSSSYSPTPERV